MTNNATINAIRNIIDNTKTRSAWSKGVQAYAEDLLDELKETLSFSPEAFDNARLLERALLNGAADWDQYSWGGCSYIYNYHIAHRLCTPSELVRTRNGDRKPNAGEEWLDVQARALYQACAMILKAYSEVSR